MPSRDTGKRYSFSNSSLSYLGTCRHLFWNPPPVLSPQPSRRNQDPTTPLEAPPQIWVCRGACGPLRPRGRLRRPCAARSGGGSWVKIWNMEGMEQVTWVTFFARVSLSNSDFNHLVHIFWGQKNLEKSVQFWLLQSEAASLLQYQNMRWGCLRRDYQAQLPCVCVWTEDTLPTYPKSCTVLLPIFLTQVCQEIPNIRARSCVEVIWRNWAEVAIHCSWVCDICITCPLTFQGFCNRSRCN